MAPPPTDTYIRGIFVEAERDKVFEKLGEIAVEGGCRALGDVKQHAHGVHVGEGRLALGKLNGRDPERPDVRLSGKNVFRDDGVACRQAQLATRRQPD